MKVSKLIGLLSLIIPILLLFQAKTVKSEKILVVAFISTRSHKITYMNLMEELATRGHEITILSPVKETKETPNIREIFTMDMTKLQDQFNIFEIKEKNIAPMNPFNMLSAFGQTCSETYDLPQVKKLMEEKFDLVFMQPLFNDCALGLVHRMNAPLVLFFPTSVPGFMVSKIGGHFHPSFISNFFLGYPSEMSFYQRFINFGMTIMIEATLRFSFEPHMTAIYREKLGMDLPNANDIFGNASLILSNGHFSLNGPKPYLPDVIDVGGIHSRPAKPLPQDLEDFVSKSGKDGFIFFSMGSGIRAHQMPEKYRKIFLTVFSKLKQQVLWKWETENMPDLPKNVKLSKWLPQQDILGHPNIRLFITHCGGGGTEESIYHAVPLLGLPMFADQPMNAKQAKNFGFLVELDWNDLNEEEFMAGIQELLNNSTYRDNVKRISEVFRDQPEHPLQRGVYWIEYVLRHKGAPQLRSASRKLNFFQYHSLDIIVTYLTIIVLAFYVLFRLGRAIFRLVCQLICRMSNSTRSIKQKTQ